MSGNDEGRTRDDGQVPRASGQAPDASDPEKSLQQLRQMEALGPLAAGMAHDLNNLLTATLAHLDLLEDRLATGDPERARGDLERIRRNALTSSQIVKHLLSFSRKERLQIQAVSLEKVVRDALDLVRPILPANISIDVRTEEVGSALADPVAVERMILALATNARDAMESGGRLEVAVEAGALDSEHAARTGWGEPGEYGVVAIRDTGHGMSPETVSRLFKPFSDPTQEKGQTGEGLSMSMVYGLMKQHRGFIDVDSEPQSGTTVKLYFRLQASRTAPTVSDTERKGDEKGTILLAEDDESLLKVGCEILNRHGYRALAAADGLQAVSVIEREGVPDLLITDLVMPSMTGMDLLRHLEEQGNLPRVLLTSGFRPDFLLEWHRDPSTFSFLEKPWTVEDLVEAVDRLIQEAHTG